MRKLSNEEFVEKSRIVHGQKYDYSKSEYTGSRLKLTIICPSHGEFNQAPAAHFSGQGCMKCRAITTGDRFRKTHEEFMCEISECHGKDKYDYSKVIYKDARTKITIICPKHGEFNQLPFIHTDAKHGCPECSYRVSEVEKEWLNSLNIPKEYRQKTLYLEERKICVDAYDPTTNTVYEFWGDYWHGNPTRYKSTDINKRNKQPFGELFRQTQIKRDLIIKAGYNLIEKWETNYVC